MIGLKGTLITGGLGLVVSLGLAFLWKSEQVKSARLEGELVQAVANSEVLKTAILEQSSTMETMTTLVRENQEWINGLTHTLDAVRAETAEERARVNALRAAEPNRALAAPFERGDAARARFTHSLQRISETSGASPDSLDPHSAGTGDSP